MRELDGPRLKPKSGQPADALVVLLHGYGANGDDLLGLGYEWAEELPKAAFYAPHAPDRLMGGFGGYQWFPLTLRDPTEYWRGVVQAGPILEAALAAELARLGLGADRLALVGFSQGTMMALHVGLRRAAAPAGILGYSGALAGPEHLPADIRCRPPVMLIHGDRDEVIPIVALDYARNGLAAAEVPVEWHIARGLGHGIDGTGLSVGGQFLKSQLGAGKN